jgi:hypothetical protein
MSDFKEKGRVGFGRGNLLWDDERNHYIIVGDGFYVLGWDENGVAKYRLNNLRSGVPYIVRNGVHVRVAPLPSLDETEQAYEESLWDS